MTTTTTRYAYDMWNPVKSGATGTSGSDIWATFTSGGSLTMRELQGDGIDQHLAYVASSNAYWYLTDHLNSIRAVVNSGGNTFVAYDAYGNLTTSAAPGLYDWTGREFDVETGLQYNRARYYDPGTGRWISQDPMGFDAGDSNLYRYVSNSPTRDVDPSGLQGAPGLARQAHDLYNNVPNLISQGIGLVVGQTMDLLFTEGGKVGVGNGAVYRDEKFVYNGRRGVQTVRVDVYARRFFLGTSIGDNNPEKFFSAVEIRFRYTKRQYTDGLGKQINLPNLETYVYAPQWLQGVFIRPTIDRYAEAFKAPELSSNYANEFFSPAFFMLKKGEIGKQ
jgi:RHS repeat-associated protein